MKIAFGWHSYAKKADTEIQTHTLIKYFVQHSGNFTCFVSVRGFNLFVSV